MLINKKNWSSNGFCVLAYHRFPINDTEKISTYFDLSRKLKNLKYEDDSDTIYSCYVSNGPQRLGKKTVGIRNRMKNHKPNQIIIKIGYNTENSPGDGRSFAVMKNPVKDRNLKLSWCETLTSNEIWIIISVTKIK